MAKDSKDLKMWIFTTLGAVAHLASFEELDAIVWEEEAALGPLRQPDKKGNCILLLPPLEVTWEPKEVSENVKLHTVNITACPGIISCIPNTVLSVSPMHPHYFINCKR